MIVPYWFWFITTSVVLLAIGISAFVIVFMKYAELDAAERKRQGLPPPSRLL